MGNQSSMSSVLPEAQVTVGEPLQSRKRPLELPERKGVEQRETVLEEFERANSYLDLTCDSDDQPALKIRRVELQNYETMAAAKKDDHGVPFDFKSTSKNALPRANNLVDYTGSRSRLVLEEDRKKTQTNPYIAHDSGGDIKKIGKEGSAAGNTSESTPRPEKMPFVDEGSNSSNISQELETRTLDLAEADLAEQLVNSESLRKSEMGLDANSNEITKSNTSNSVTQNAIARKERIEREGAEKSRALREATKKQRGQTAEQNRVEDMVDLSHLNSQVENCSPSTHTISAETSTASTAEDSDPGAMQYIQNGHEEALLCESQNLVPTTETTHANGEHVNPDATKTLPKLPSVATTFTQCNETQGDATSKDVVEIEDLEEGAQKLEAYINMNERQKAGPKTLFTPRHKLDTLDCSSKKTQATAFSPTPRLKFHSPYGEPVRRTSEHLRRPEGANESLFPAPKEASKTLHRAPNRNGGLAMLAQTAGVEDDAPLTQSPYASAKEVPNGELNRTDRSTVSASEYRTDLSRYRYTKPLTQEEQDIIHRHDWLKERQRDLKTLKATYIEVAKLSCITGVTKWMEGELAKTDEFKEIVLEQGKTNKAKRNRVKDIRTKMVSRQTSDVPAERMEEKLGLFIDRKSLQRLDDELESVETEMEIVRTLRYEKSTHRGTREKKEKVRSASSDVDGGASKPRPRIDLPEKEKVARPKFGTDEYRQNQSATYWNSEARKEAILKEKLKNFDEVTTEPSAENVDTMNAATQVTNEAEKNVQSEVSEEDDDWEMYPQMESISKAADRAPACAQAPDMALAEKMRRAHLGIPEQDDDDETISDAGSDTSGKSGDGEAQMVNNYVVYGSYTGIAELEDCATYRLGRFLKKENAETLIGEKVVEFCDTRKRDIASATEAKDEEWLARLGDPEEGKLKHDMKTKEQIVEFPASTCRIWMEMERVEARSREERKAASAMSTNTYVALFERTFSDGSKETPSWDELVTCSGPNGIWLANREACRIMGRWYSEHMKDGDLAMQEAALEEKVRELGEEGLFDEEEDFQVPGGGKESMRVWVDWKRNRG